MARCDYEDIVEAMYNLIKSTRLSKNKYWLFKVALFLNKNTNYIMMYSEGELI